MQGQRAYISAEFFAALGAQNYEPKCQCFANSPSTSMLHKTGMLLQANFI